MLDELAVPAGLAVGDDALFVSDWATGMIYRIASDGSSEIVIDGLQFPEGIAVYENHLLVVETGTDRSR